MPVIMAMGQPMSRPFWYSSTRPVCVDSLMKFEKAIIGTKLIAAFHPTAFIAIFSATALSSETGGIPASVPTPQPITKLVII